MKIKLIALFSIFATGSMVPALGPISSLTTRAASSASATGISVMAANLSSKIKDSSTASNAAAAATGAATILGMVDPMFATGIFIGRASMGAMAHFGSEHASKQLPVEPVLKGSLSDVLFKGNVSGKIDELLKLQDELLKLQNERKSRESQNEVNNDEALDDNASYIAFISKSVIAGAATLGVATVLGDCCMAGAMCGLRLSKYELIYKLMKNKKRKQREDSFMPENIYQLADVYEEAQKAIDAKTVPSLTESKQILPEVQK